MSPTLLVELMELRFLSNFIVFRARDMVSSHLFISVMKVLSCFIERMVEGGI